MVDREPAAMETGESDRGRFASIRHRVRRALAAPFDEAINRRWLGRLEIGTSNLILAAALLFGPLVLARAILPGLIFGPWLLVNVVAACLVVDFAIKAARIVATRRSADVRRALVSILVASTLICLEHMKDGMAGAMRRLYEDADRTTEQNYTFELQRFDKRVQRAAALRQHLYWEKINRQRLTDSIAKTRGSEAVSRRAGSVEQSGHPLSDSPVQGENEGMALVPPEPHEIGIPNWLILVEWGGPFAVSFLALVVLLGLEGRSSLQSQANKRYAAANAKS